MIDLFEDHRQLIVGHFMFDPEWDEGCASCSAGADEMSEGHLMHLHARDTTFAYVSRAPIDSIERYKLMKAWTFPWYSSYGSDFNYDFHVTLDPAIATPEYNYEPFDMTRQDAKSMELPGRSHFLRVGDDIFHTYSVFARGLESIGGSYYLLDETALGRQEEWEEPKRTRRERSQRYARLRDLTRRWRFTRPSRSSSGRTRQHRVRMVVRARDLELQRAFDL